MLYTPATGHRSKRGLFGLVTSNGPSGPWMRRLAFPVQTNTDASNNWRAIFITTKQNWAALAPGGTGYILNEGIAPQQAWAMLADTYFGILEAGLNAGSLITKQRLIGCATEDAFYSMCQANAASLGYSPIPTPALVNQYLAMATSPNVQTVDVFTVTMTGPTSPNPTNPSITVDVQFSATVLPAAPTSFQASCTGLLCQTSAPALNFDTIEEQTLAIYSASYSSGQITFIVPADTGNIVPGQSVVTISGCTPAAYNTTKAMVTAVTSTSVSIAAASNPGSLTTAGNLTDYTIVSNWYETSLVIIPTSATSAGSYTVNFSFYDTNGLQSGSITVNSSAGTVQIADPCPSFSRPSSMGAQTLYDNNFNVQGFKLSYSTVEGYTFPMFRGVTPIAGVWEISASDVYSSSYSPPAASSWQPILFYGPYLPTPSILLTAWQKLYGSLPASGNIKFQAQYIDPVTCASGPALSCTATWKNGTLKGASLAEWTGPIFGWSTPASDFTVTAPGNSSQTIAFVGSGGYGGDITLSVVRVKFGSTYDGNFDTTLPAGVTYTFTPNPITIPSGSTTPVTCVFEATAVSGAGEFYAQIAIKATDSIASRKLKIIMQVNGVVTGQPYPTGLYINPASSSYAAPNPGTGSVAYTLENTTLDDIAVSMTAVADDPTAVLSYDNVSFTVPAATPYGPAPAPATSSSGNLIYNNTIGAPAGSLVGSVLQASGYSPEDYNMLWGVITANDASTITVLKGSTAPPMTVEGEISANAPGYAACNLSITLPGTRPSVGDQIQVTAGAGTQTAYAALFLE